MNQNVEIMSCKTTQNFEIEIFWLFFFFLQVEVSFQRNTKKKPIKKQKKNVSSEDIQGDDS